MLKQSNNKKQKDSKVELYCPAKKFTKTGHTISARIGKAIGDYSLIEKGDRILIAVSGGKDSLTLLKLLRQRQRWSPVRYEIFAAHIQTDFVCASCTHTDVLEKLFEGMGIEYRMRKIKVLDKNKKTSCFWCSWNRRKALFEIAGKLGCTKLALGHHKDDIVETTLLNLLFQGEFSTMNPRQELFSGELAIIRPLCYVEEYHIKKFAKENEFPSKLCKCPFGQDSKRKLIKEFISDTERKSPRTNIKTNIFKSLSRIRTDRINVKEK